MIDTPRLVHVEARHTAVIRHKIPRAEIQTVMGPSIREVMSAVAAQNLAPTGPVFSHHFRMAPDIFDFEVGIPVATPVAAVGRVQPGLLPAVRIAQAHYYGGYEGLGAAWGALCAWIAAQGLTPRDDLWEYYLSGPESGADSSRWCTELCRPLHDAA